ncbi:flagellar basal body rod modification domain protein [Actinomyces sp. oral taxon 170 str. F0386]|nr:flagellar basal body rod modification domain protein [Actinomyces sp. oral taxon 170 str. F0386]
MTGSGCSGAVPAVADMVGVVPCPETVRAGGARVTRGGRASRHRPEADGTAVGCVRRQLFSLGVAASLGSGVTDR